MPEYKCGCVNETHVPSGILHCVRKCRRHAAKYRDPATLDERYYEELGVIKDGKLLPTKHVEELTEALGKFPHGCNRMVAMEIGGGVSPYAGTLMADAGWGYAGIDVSPWAVDWMRKHYASPKFWCDCLSFEDVVMDATFGLILAAHCLEHMYDAPRAVAKMARHLMPGGELWIVMPDDGDPVNPDHWWFMTETTLRSTLEAAGLTVERLEVRKYIERESFIYARARRPV